MWFKPLQALVGDIIRYDNVATEEAVDKQSSEQDLEAARDSAQKPCLPPRVS